MTEYPLLGGHCWGVTVEVDGQPVRLRVLGAEKEPAPETLEALQEIARTFARREAEKRAGSP